MRTGDTCYPKRIHLGRGGDGGQGCRRPHCRATGVSIADVVVSLAPAVREGECAPAAGDARNGAGDRSPKEEVAMVRGIDLPKGGGLWVHNCEGLKIRNLLVRSSTGRRLPEEMQRC